MRANTTKISARRRRNARRRRALALGLGICALALPAGAGADPSAPGYSRADAIAQGLEESSPAGGNSDYSSVNAITGPYTGEPTAVVGSPSVSGEGFDWPSALVGAGAALALAALGTAALLTFRRRTTISPSGSTT
jgi:hypothetical protein